MTKHRALSALVTSLIFWSGTLAIATPQATLEDHRHVTAREITKDEAIARVRSILTRQARACGISRVRSIAARQTAYGWRVTANVAMSASGRSRSETPSWLVSLARGTTAQDPLAADIGSGCR